MSAVVSRFTLPLTWRASWQAVARQRPLMQRIFKVTNDGSWTEEISPTRRTKHPPLPMIARPGARRRKFSVDRNRRGTLPSRMTISVTYRRMEMIREDRDNSQHFHGGGLGLGRPSPVTPRRARGCRTLPPTCRAPPRETRAPPSASSPARRRRPSHPSPPSPSRRNPCSRRDSRSIHP